MRLVMGYTGKKAMAIKIAHINAFDTINKRLSRLQMHHVAINQLISKEQADNINHFGNRCDFRNG
ncbi:MAG: hypothetical protein J6574_08500 [Gilliamella sp.]|nr:hypothetical protein [Gilliamella sp.]